MEKVRIDLLKAMEDAEKYIIQYIKSRKLLGSKKPRLVGYGYHWSGQKSAYAEVYFGVPP